MSWLRDNKNHPVLVIRYEELRKNTQRELSKMLDFLHVPFSTTKLDKVRWKENDNGDFGNFKFTDTQQNYVNSVIQKTAEVLSMHSLTKDINLANYFRY